MTLEVPRSQPSPPALRYRPRQPFQASRRRPCRAVQVVAGRQPSRRGPRARRARVPNHHFALILVQTPDEKKWITMPISGGKLERMVLKLLDFGNRAHDLTMRQRGGRKISIHCDLLHTCRRGRRLRRGHQTG